MKFIYRDLYPTAQRPHPRNAVARVFRSYMMRSETSERIVSDPTLSNFALRRRPCDARAFPVFRHELPYAFLKRRESTELGVTGHVFACRRAEGEDEVLVLVPHSYD